MTPDESLLRRAAEILNAGEKVAILIGAGARGAAPEVIEVADRLGAGVAKALLGKDALPDTLPFVTGSIGLLGTEASEKMMNKCDTLLMVGTSFPYSEWLPKPGQAKCVEIDIDGSLIGVRYPNDVSLVGDSRDTLRALIPMLETKRDRSWQEWIVEERKIWNEILDKRAHQSADPKNPETQTLPYLPAAEFAKLLGFEGIKVERPEDVGPAWDRALSAGAPVLLEFVTDPSVAALPPHVRYPMAKKVAKALVHGDEDAKGIAEHGFKGKLTEFTEHAKGKLGKND